MKDFFNKTIHGKVHRQGNVVIDLTAIPSNAFTLYLEGLPYLTLTPDAKTLFLKISKEKLLQLIALKKKQKRKGDVTILQEVLNERFPKETTKSTRSSNK
ncbi:hypothetical protein TMP248_140038 [Tenacibaculum maritimum]|uniref:hypothetical protein n=1 Tax=Tenacibaculum maritimum TaxID=107401 RepID=UPI0012E43265|nr:hypothetical protein [Tenacibaculum maritimum]CAA0170465.1 conserved hypothetical protein [Tenacibaculum maritimum]CAA0172925.1 hypothetical protein TMP248_140038 [Tenacibaculum maritimum]